MFAYLVVVGTILASVFAWTGQTSAGWIIDQVVKGETGRQQMMLQANRMKTLMWKKDGEPAAAFILDLDAGTITLVDYEERHFVTTTIQEYAQMTRGVQQMAAEMAEAMKEMQEAMKEMPPEQRKMMEQMMRSQMGQTKPTPEDCSEPRIEVRKTGQQATIAGYPAVRYDVLADGKPQSELWIAKDIAAWQELDPQKLERFSAEMAKLAACNSTRGRHGLPGDDPAWKLASEGYPVRTVDRSGSGGTVEVVKAEIRTIPAAEFQPPPSFARKTLREMMEQ